MKDIFKSWRVQRGSKVKYAHDRSSGQAIVLEVLETRGFGGVRFKIRDLKTNVELEVDDSEIVFIPKIDRKKK